MSLHLRQLEEGGKRGHVVVMSGMSFYVWVLQLRGPKGPIQEYPDRFETKAEAKIFAKNLKRDKGHYWVPIRTRRIPINSRTR